MAALAAATGRVTVSGMGKSGHVGRKIAATLASTGTPAFCVHPGEAGHGDLGMITDADVVLAISYSGECDEILMMLPALRRQGNAVIAMTGRPQSTLALEADETRKRRKGEEEEIHIQRLMPADALRIRGRHNAVNALAALALASAAGCSLGPMLYGLRDYRGEPHRVESVAIVHGVEYFDDSKGTNVGATVAALQGLGADRSVVLILGGEGKGQDFSPLAAPVARFARAVVLIGRDAPLIRAALDAAGVPLFDASTMDDAVAQATVHAQAGDAVLMSPACASFDMFDNYEHRARVFCAAVETLAAESGVFVEGAA